MFLIWWTRRAMHKWSLNENDPAHLWIDPLCPRNGPGDVPHVFLGGSRVNQTALGVHYGRRRREAGWLARQPRWIRASFRVVDNVSTTLGRFLGVRDNFHLNFVCGWLCMLTSSETARTKNVFNVIMSTSNATTLAKKMFRGCHFMGLNSLNFILCSWWHLVPHRWKDPVFTQIIQSKLQERFSA